MIDYVKTNVPGLLKDKKTNTVINKNDGDFARIVSARQKGKELTYLKNEVALLKEQIKIIFKKLEIDE